MDNNILFGHGNVGIMHYYPFILTFMSLVVTFYSVSEHQNDLFTIKHSSIPNNTSITLTEPFDTTVVYISSKDLVIL